MLGAIEDVEDVASELVGGTGNDADAGTDEAGADDDPLGGDDAGGTDASGVRCEPTATGSVGGAHAASSSRPVTATTTVSDRIRRNGSRTGSGTAARYRAGKCHKPRQSSTKTCKVCSRSSSTLVLAPMTYS